MNIISMQILINDKIFWNVSARSRNHQRKHKISRNWKTWWLQQKYHDNPPSCKLYYSLWHQYSKPWNLFKCCSKWLKYFIQVYVYLPVFKDFFTLYPPFICHNLSESRTCLFPILCNIYETLTVCSLHGGLSSPFPTFLTLDPREINQYTPTPVIKPLNGYWALALCQVLF